MGILTQVEFSLNGYDIWYNENSIKLFSHVDAEEMQCKEMFKNLKTVVNFLGRLYGPHLGIKIQHLLKPSS